MIEALEKHVVPKLFEGKARDGQVRVWVAGSATGEEAYSIAILLAEHAAGVPNAPSIQVFATDIDENAIAARLYAPEMPEPDLLIRTSGEVRLSNFLLWQSAYSELLFLDTLWPDFGEAEFASALDHFAVRERRFGGR